MTCFSSLLVPKNTEKRCCKFLRMFQADYGTDDGQGEQDGVEGDGHPNGGLSGEEHGHAGQTTDCASVPCFRVGVARWVFVWQCRTRCNDYAVRNDPACFVGFLTFSNVCISTKKPMVRC